MLIITPERVKHIAEHSVTPQEVFEAFASHEDLVQETRPEHQRDCPVYYFIAETDHGRELKVVVADRPEIEGLVLITAYDANKKWKAHYEKARKKTN